MDSSRCEEVSSNEGQQHARKRTLRPDIGVLHKVVVTPPMPRATIAAAAGIGLAAGATAALARSARVEKARNAAGDGNSMSGYVAVRLLDKIDLLTIRLRVRHVPADLALPDLCTLRDN
jgi:hypothetical protein